MKNLSKLALCLLLAMSLTVSAFAAQIPDSLVVENLNGQQRLVKTYTLSPEVDPDKRTFPTTAIFIPGLTPPRWNTRIWKANP